MQELHQSKIQHELVRNNQTQKKDTIDKAIEEGPKKNLKKLQDNIVKLYTDIQKIHEEYVLESETCKDYERENLE